MKRYYGVLFATVVILALSLAACGSSNDTATEQPADPAPADSSSPESPAADAGDSAAGNEEQVDLPSSVTIATHSAGGAYHATGSGVAKLLTDNTPIRGIVQPTAGPNAWMNDLDTGSIEFGLLQAMDAGWAYTGGPGFEEPAKNLRMVLAGNQVFNTGFATRENSGIESLADLAGKRVGSDYGGNFSLGALGEAALASVGLTWDDVSQVPVPEFNTGLSALQDGTLQATMAASPTTPDTVQTDAAIGLKILPFGDLKPEDIQDGIPSEMEEILSEYVPGVTLGVAPAGMGMLTEDTVMFEYQIYMAAGAHVDDDVVYTVLKAIYEHHEQIADVHPWLAEWDPGIMLADNPPAPYHDGAIKFFKEIGEWTDSHQQIQDELLAN